MISSLWKKLKEVVFKDVGRESESNDLSVLLRCMSLVQILILLFMAVVMAYLNEIFLCMSCVFLIGFLSSVLILTYEDRTVAGMYIFIIANHLFIAVSSLLTAWKHFYTPMVLICIMLFFFNVRVSMKVKVYYAIAEAAFVIGLLVAEYLRPANPAMSMVPEAVLISCNVLCCIGCVSFEAYSYSLKYTKNEEKIMQYNKKLEDMVSRDALTGLWNRRAMNEHLSLLENNYRKHQKTFSVAIMDIDFFKKVNDTYGHGMGDFVLKSLSAILKDYMEERGSVARWGGEEFLLTFEGGKFENAVKEMDRLRDRISLHEFAFKDVKLHLTVTGGIEDYAMVDSVDAVITKADERLYKGKTGGRNRVVSVD
ncbi:MAG: GGDEF domain-containing protein [Lachnospiraceae bacterium]|nr:GGDEF domain-containing protein [Lachnospiraceae bacterium]